MSPTQLRKLRQLARLEGVHLSYIDCAGRRQETSVETLRAVLTLFGNTLDSA